MRVGLALPQYEIDRDPAGEPLLPSVLGIARRAEALGLDSVWLSDHPFAVGPDGVASGALEPFALLGALGRATGRMGLGTLVLSSTMRSPGLVAHAARTLAASAPGRVVVGIGAGWYEPEHRAFGLALPSYRDRVALVDATAAALAGIAEPYDPAILIGGSGAPILAAAARRADVWNVSWDPPPETFAALSRRLDQSCADAGRDPSTVRRSVGVTVLVGSSSSEIERSVEKLRARAEFLAGVDRAALAERIIVGTPGECAERIAAYGAEEVVVALLLRDDLEMLELFASEVAPVLRGARAR